MFNNNLLNSVLRDPFCYRNIFTATIFGRNTIDSKNSPDFENVIFFKNLVLPTNVGLWTGSYYYCTKCKHGSTFLVSCLITVVRFQMRLFSAATLRKRTFTFHDHFLCSGRLLAGSRMRIKQGCHVGSVDSGKHQKCEKMFRRRLVRIY